MKRIFTLLIFVFAISTISFGQKQASSIPDMTVELLSGEKVQISSVINKGKPTIVSFWATWCKPCINELTNISDVYEDWQNETGVKIVAISIDNARSKNRVKPKVETEGWEYDVILDSNNDLKRKMNVITVPHVFVLDGNGKVAWQHKGYKEGDEEHLLEVVKKVAAGEDVSNM